MNSNTNKSKTASTTSGNFNNHIKNSPHEVSEAFDDYFTNIAPKLTDKLSHLETSLNLFLCGNYNNSMRMPPVTTDEIIKVTNALKNKNGHIDEVPVHVIEQNT